MVEQRVWWFEREKKISKDIISILDGVKKMEDSYVRSKLSNLKIHMEDSIVNEQVF